MCYLAAVSPAAGVQPLGLCIEGWYKWFWHWKESYNGSFHHAREPLEVDCLSSTITIPAVRHIGPVANVWTKARRALMVDSLSSTMKRHFKHARMRPAVDFKCLSWLIPIHRSTVSMLCGLGFLHLVDPVQWTIWTACLSRWKDITLIATLWYRVHFASFRWLKYRLPSMTSLKLANLLKPQAMWFFNSPFGIAHHSARSSTVWVSGHRFFITCLLGPLVSGISLSQSCFPAFAFSSWYWNTTFRAFFCKVWKLASSWFDCWYACSRSIITLAGSSELALKRLPSCPIWSEE